MTEVSSLLYAPSASRIHAQAAGRLAVSRVSQRPRPPRGDTSIVCDAPLATPNDSPHLEDLAALAPDQENDIP